MNYEIFLHEISHINLWEAQEQNKWIIFCYLFQGRAQYFLYYIKKKSQNKSYIFTLLSTKTSFIFIYILYSHVGVQTHEISTQLTCHMEKPTTSKLYHKVGYF